MGKRVRAGSGVVSSMRHSLGRAPGQHKRTLQGNGGENVTDAAEPTGHAPSVGKVFFPLDEELGLLPGNLAPRQHEHLVHLACFMPFDKVREMMEEIISVQTNQETVRRLTEQIGSWMEAVQTVEIDAHSEPEVEEIPPLHRCAFSADGAMISLVNKQWVETRTVAIGEPQEKLNAKGEKERSMLANSRIFHGWRMPQPLPIWQKWRCGGAR